MEPKNSEHTDTESGESQSTVPSVTEPATATDGSTGELRFVPEDSLGHEARQRRIEAIFDQTYQFTGLLKPDGTLVEANRTALEFGGLDREDVLGEKMWDAYWFRHDEETRRQARRAVERAADGEFVRQELQVRGADRDAVIDFSVRPVTDEDGHVTLLIPEGRDITERKRHRDRLKTLNEATSRLCDATGEVEIAEVAVDIAETVLDESLVAIWTYDADCNELVPLAGSDTATDVDAADQRDTGFGSIHSDTTEMKVFREGETTVVEDYESVDAPAHPETSLGTLLMAPLGEYGQLHVGRRTVTEFDDATREVIDILAQNVTTALEGEARQQTLGRNRDRLARTEKLADVGGWEFDLQTDTLRWTDGTQRIHDVSESHKPDLESALEFYHPEDREQIRKAVAACRETGTSFNVEARLVTAEGRERWVEATGEPVEMGGERVRIEGAIRDITDRKRREQQLSVLYRIMRHNLRNDLTVIGGYAAEVGQEMERLGRELDTEGDPATALDRLVEATPDSPQLQSDIDTLRQTVAAAEAVEPRELGALTDRIRSKGDELMAIGDKANRLRDLITDVGGNDRTNDLESAIETAVETVRQDYPKATVRVGDLDGVPVDGSPRKIVFAVHELLENAILHDEDAQPVAEVRTRRDGDGRVDVEVADQGPGIPDCELEALRSGDERALLHGSGIGLWLVNWLVTFLDGTLRFEGNDPCGTVVTMTLPVVDGDGGGIESVRS